MMLKAVRAALFILAAWTLSVALAQVCSLTPLSKAEADQVHEDYRDQLVEPGPSQLRVLESAAQYLTPLQCAAIRGVAFTEAEVTAGALTLGWVMTQSHNSVLHISALANNASEHDLASTRPEVRSNVWLTTIETIAHESVHSAVHLFNTQLKPDAVNCVLFGFFCDDPTDASQWPSEATALVREATARLRLQGGILTEWQRIHQSFVAAGWAQPYGGAPAVAGLAEAGFMSGYGAREPNEDIAEMASLASTRGVDHIVAIDLPVNRAEARDHACTKLNSSGGTISNTNAAVYTKLAFLRDAGLLAESQFDACVGDTRLNMPPGDGFHFYVDGEYTRTMNSNVEAHMGTHERTGEIMFELVAEGSASFQGESTDARVILRLSVAPAGVDIDTASWPRGLYPFHTGSAILELTLADAPAGNFVADMGFVLVTTATGDMIEGAINLQRAWRPDAPVPVPMAADALPSIRFRISGGS